MATSRMAEQVGRVLGGRYRLLALVGTGASARVFLAEDVVLRRRVAVKLLHAALAGDESFLRRFRAEARTVAALSHPHIAAVHDWGEEDDGPYLVLEHLGGGSLRNLLDRGHLLSPAQALTIGLDTAHGLAYAHRRGLAHRDVKPANLLFDDDGRLRIADFGLARALAEAAWTEPSGAVVGSARYASPEQAQGASLDGRSDVYSLALVLIEAVTGRVPFAADTTIATLMARVGTPLLAPPELGPLAPAIEAAGRPDPTERLDAADFVAALERAIPQLDHPDPLPLSEASAAGMWAPDDSDPTLLPPSLNTWHRRLTATEAGAEPPRSSSSLLSPEDDLDVDRYPVSQRRWLPLLLVAALVALVVAAGAYALIQVRLPSYKIPTLVNGTEAQARATLGPLGLKVNVDRQFVDGTVKGVVLDQDPKAGSLLRQGRTVHLTVSNGPPLVAVPYLAGLDQGKAKEKLAKRGLTAAIQPRFDEQIPKGQVITWSHRGQKRPKGQAVTIIVSEGPQPREVPNLAGRTFEQAEAGLAARQLRATKTEVFSDKIERGKVVGTEPAAGRTAARDSTVAVKISKGPDLIKMPQVVGLSALEAERRLSAAGLRVTTVSGPPSGRVFATDPKAGATVKRKSGVTLATHY